MQRSINSLIAMNGLQASLASDVESCLCINERQTGSASLLHWLYCLVRKLDGATRCSHTRRWWIPFGMTASKQCCSNVSRTLRKTISESHTDTRMADALYKTSDIIHSVIDSLVFSSLV